MKQIELLKEIIKMYISAYEKAYSGLKTKEEIEENIGGHSNLEKLNIGAYVDKNSIDEAKKGDPDDNVYAVVKIPKLGVEFNLSHGTIGIEYTAKNDTIIQIDVGALLADIHECLVGGEPFEKEEIAYYERETETVVKKVVKKIVRTVVERDEEAIIKAELYDNLFDREISIKERK